MGQISKLKGNITPWNLSNLVCLHVFMQIKKKIKKEMLYLIITYYVRGVWNTFITWDPLLNIIWGKRDQIFLYLHVPTFVLEFRRGIVDRLVDIFKIFFLETVGWTFFSRRLVNISITFSSTLLFAIYFIVFIHRR